MAAFSVSLSIVLLFCSLSNWTNAQFSAVEDSVEKIKDGTLRVGIYRLDNYGTMQVEYELQTPSVDEQITDNPPLPTPLVDMYKFIVASEPVLRMPVYAATVYKDELSVFLWYDEEIGKKFALMVYESYQKEFCGIVGAKCMMKLNVNKYKNML